MDSNGMTTDADKVIRVDLGTVHMLASEREFIWGACTERERQANAAGVHYSWPDFVRQALIEAAQR